MLYGLMLRRGILYTYSPAIHPMLTLDGARSSLEEPIWLVT